MYAIRSYYGDFAISTSPATTVAGLDSTTFSITFTPSQSGERTAVVSISSNDPDENPYTFTVGGYAYNVMDLVVTGITSPLDANTTYVHQGVSYNFV